MNVDVFAVVIAAVAGALVSLVGSLLTVFSRLGRIDTIISTQFTDVCRAVERHELELNQHDRKIILLEYEQRKGKTND